VGLIQETNTGILSGEAAQNDGEKQKQIPPRCVRNDKSKSRSFPFGFAQGQDDNEKTKADSSATLRNDKSKSRSFPFGFAQGQDDGEKTNTGILSGETAQNDGVKAGPSATPQDDGVKADSSATLLC